MNKLPCLLPFLALSAFAAAPPDNDNFANRTALVSSGSISVADRNASATTQASEPTVAGDIVSRSVWYSWTAPFTGPVMISTAGSSFDTLLGVFTGTALGALTSIAENDDAGTGAYTSTVNFNAVSGIPYVILVGGFNGAGGKIRLTITVGSGPCSYGVTPTSKSFSSAAGSGTVTVTTSAGCSWSAMSNDSFISITTTSTVTGSGSVSYAVAANTALTARVGTMTIAGATVTIDQAPAPACTYALFPTSTNAPSDSVTNSVAMTAGAGCAWNATPNASWISIISGASGTGSGSIGYALAANTNSNQRVSTITAAGQSFTITQAGVLTCTYSISPSSGSFSSAGGSSNIVISTTSGCAWTASSPVTWVTFTTVNGSGNATVTYTVAANTNTVSRSTTLTVAGRPYAVSQTGTACTYSINPSSINAAATASSSTVAVAAGSGCTWTAVANVSWLTITAGTSGTGSGSVVFTIAANVNTVTRAGTLTIAGKTFTVNQAAAACIYSIAPTAAHYVAAGGPGNISVTAGTGCAWTAVANDAWITIDSGSPGTGNGVVGYTVAANVTAVSCTGTITVAGQTFTITQDGTAPCTYSILPASASFTSSGGTNSIAVTANPGCTWSVSSGATWLTFTPSSGSGNGTVTYTVAANSSSLTRTGTLTVAGQTFTVTQTGVPCIYGIIPTSASYNSAGGNGTVAVSATQGCNWTSSSDSSWLIITSGSAGVGNGNVSYSVGAATNSATRSGRLTIATKLLIVTQTGISCNYSISPTSTNVNSSASGDIITITASSSVCSWTATSGASWLTVSPGSGTGSGSVSYTVASTALASTRTGTLTIAGQTFTVTQAGDTTIPVVSLTAPANGSTISNIVTLTATATDSNMARVDFYLDGAMLGSDLTSPYSLPYNTANSANGSHGFFAKAFDVAGNQGISSTSTVTISNSTSTNGQFQWAVDFGGSGAFDSAAGSAVVFDSNSNSIVSGHFSGTVNFGGGALTSAGGSDVFIAKYSASGVHQWSKRFGGTGNEVAPGIAVDSTGNVVIVGYFSGGAEDFGGGPLASAGLDDVFVAKYSPAGSHVWSKRIGGASNDHGFGVAIDTADNVIVTGYFVGSVDFGGGSLISAGVADIFVAKYSSSGTHVWSKRIGGASSDVAQAIRTDTAGNVVVTGYFQGTVDFGGGVVTSSGGNDIFVVKLSGLGAHLWSYRFGGTSDDYGYGVTFDPTGNVILTGAVTGIVTFGGTTFADTGGGADIFVAKYSPTGLHLWSKRFGSSVSYGDSAAAVTADSNGNVVITGFILAALDFGGGALLNSAGAGSSDIFIVKFTTTGGHVWSKRFGGPPDESGRGVAVDSGGNVGLTGYFGDTADFGGGILSSPGGTDAFLSRFSP